MLSHSIKSIHGSRTWPPRRLHSLSPGQGASYPPCWRLWPLWAQASLQTHQGKLAVSPHHPLTPGPDRGPRAPGGPPATPSSPPSSGSRRAARLPLGAGSGDGWTVKHPLNECSIPRIKEQNEDSVTLALPQSLGLLQVAHL